MLWGYITLGMITGLHIWSAVLWFYTTKDLNPKAKQSFPPILYSILWLIPFINWLILWSTIGDIQEKQKGRKISRLRAFYKIWIPYILMGFDLGPLFLILLAIILLPFPAGVLNPIINVVTFVIPLLASIWFFYEIKKLRLIIAKL